MEEEIKNKEKRENKIEETAPKDDKKDTNEESDQSHNFEIEECRMHENEYPSSNDLVYVIEKLKNSVWSQIYLLMEHMWSY